MKITVLSENTVLNETLVPEFGLSVWVEKGDTRLLFDTGTGRAFLENAQALAIDISSCTAVAFSHNHRDHCGGFLHLNGMIAADCPIYARAGFFTDKWWNHHFDDPNGPTFAPTVEQVGPPMSSDYFFQHGLTGFRVLTDDVFSVGDDIYLVGNFPIARGIEEVHCSQLMSDSFGQFTRDTFRDEQACVIKTSEGLVLLTGCAHNGIMNIIETVKKHFAGQPIRALLGGTHLVPPNDERTEATIEYLTKQNIGCLGVCHCTGPALPKIAESVGGYTRTGAGLVYECAD